jgi:hypothetical protein
VGSLLGYHDVIFDEPFGTNPYVSDLAAKTALRERGKRSITFIAHDESSISRQEELITGQRTI